MDENISVMNKYLELYYAAVRSLVHKAQQTICQLLFTVLRTGMRRVTKFFSTNDRI